MRPKRASLTAGWYEVIADTDGGFDVVVMVWTGECGSTTDYICANLWDADNGAPDVTGIDDGQDKIDTYVYSTNAAALTNGVIADLTASAASSSLIFLHDYRPDSALHSSGCGSAAYNNSIINVDQSLGQIMQTIRDDPALNGHTAIILSSDHGCSGTGHGTPGLSANYTIPFMVWLGDGMQTNDLYALNSASRTDPGEERPADAPAPDQPIRNADAGNLALDLLGLTAIPNSLVNAELDLDVFQSGGTFVDVPDVLGLAQAEAEAAIIASGLVVGNITEAGSNTVPAGNVISQSPIGGLSVPEGRSVNLVVSLGPVLTYTFQEGQGVYAGTHDTFLQEFVPENVNGALPGSEWDDDDPNGEGTVNVALIRFENIIGSDPGQIPVNSDIASATLSYTIGGDGGPDGVTAELHEARVDWDQSSVNWNNYGSDAGIQVDEYDSTVITDMPAPAVGNYPVDVTSSLQDWVNGTSANQGWIVIAPPPGPAGGGAQMRSSEYLGNIAERPKLTVVFEEIPPTEPPDAPTILEATVSSSSQIDLTWVDNAYNESGFEIEWSPDEAFVPFIHIATVPANTTSYSHSGLAPESQNCYQVQAINILGPSDYTDVECATTPEGLATISFQEGVNGYAGTVDTHIMESEPTASHGTIDTVGWDTDDPSGFGQYNFALIRFDDIFGSGLGQIPEGANILSATLTYVVYNDGHSADVNEVSIPWLEDVTYDGFGVESGVQGDEYGASRGTASGGTVDVYTMDVRASLMSWSNNPAANHGWIFRPTGTNGVDFRSSEYATASERPKLTIVYSTGDVVYFEDFGDTAGADPADWLDTGANNSLEPDDLFQTYNVGGEIAFGTASTASNIHSHYTAAGYDAGIGFIFTGRMRMSASNSGIGVTFLSDYPNSDTYYRLRRYGSTAFHISPHGGTTVSGTTDSGVTPEADTWYEFKIEVVDTGSLTEIRANIWPESSGEPAEWQIEANDASDDRLTFGHIGVWGNGAGSKYWDDFTVEMMVP